MLGIAASNNEVEMVLALIEKGCDPAYNGTSSLMFDYYSAGDNYVGGVDRTEWVYWILELHWCQERHHIVLVEILEVAPFAKVNIISR